MYRHIESCRVPPKRLISFRELDEIEGLVEHHRKVQERLKALEADAAQFDTPAQDLPVLA